MKLGTENRTKTIVAVLLMAVALIFFARMFFGSSGYSAPPTAKQPAPAATSPSGTAGTTPPATTRPTARNNRRGAQNAPVVASQSLDPRLKLDLLQRAEATKYTGTGRNIFSDEPPPPPPAPAEVHGPMTPVETGPPPPPPINLKFFGFASSKTDPAKKIFLSQGEDVFVAREGDIVQRRYRILRINNTSVDVEDVLTNHRQTIPLTAG